MSKMQVTPAAMAAAASGDISNMMAAMTPGGIEAQEAAGQRDFVANETLPIQGPRDVLETLGFVFGDKADDLFVHVQFPEGWSKRPTDHSMWSDLLDPEGNVRASIFYKAAFYDRDAFYRLNRRFSSGLRYGLEDRNTVQAEACDAGKAIFRTEPVTVEYGSEAYWAAQDKAEGEARAWLKEQFPKFEDPLAHWDAETTLLD